MRNRQGAYAGEVRTDVELFFGVQLPGLSRDSGRQDEKR